MGRILRTSQALDDLEGIWSFIAQQSLSAADRTIDRLYERFQLLAEHPELGERQPGLADGVYRRFSVQSYVIYYAPDEKGITVVRVLHGARDETGLF